MRKVASDHSMIAEGHKTVAEGWRMFEEAVDESMPGDLPQLLRQLKEKMTPMPPPSPMDIGQGNSTEPTSSSNTVPSKKGGGELRVRSPLSL